VEELAASQLQLGTLEVLMDPEVALELLVPSALLVDPVDLVGLQVGLVKLLVGLVLLAALALLDLQKFVLLALPVGLARQELLESLAQVAQTLAHAAALGALELLVLLEEPLELPEVGHQAA